MSAILSAAVLSLREVTVACARVKATLRDGSKRAISDQTKRSCRRPLLYALLPQNRPLRSKGGKARGSYAQMSARGLGRVAAVGYVGISRRAGGDAQGYHVVRRED